jgi:hypothetical protein
LTNKNNQGETQNHVRQDCTIKCASNKDRNQGTCTLECPGGAQQPFGYRSRPADQRKEKYERTEGRQDTRAGHYARKLLTGAGEVELEIPKLRTLTFETAIIERCRRRESSVEEVLVEMYLAGMPTRRIEDITQLLWDAKLSQPLEREGIRSDRSLAKQTPGRQLSIRIFRWHLF